MARAIDRIAVHLLLNHSRSTHSMSLPTQLYQQSDPPIQHVARPLPHLQRQCHAPTGPSSNAFANLRDSVHHNQSRLRSPSCVRTWHHARLLRRIHLLAVGIEFVLILCLRQDGRRREDGQPSPSKPFRRLRRSVMVAHAALRAADRLHMFCRGCRYTGMIYQTGRRSIGCDG